MEKGMLITRKPRRVQKVNNSTTSVYIPHIAGLEAGDEIEMFLYPSGAVLLVPNSCLTRQLKKAHGIG